MGQTQTDDLSATDDSVPRVVAALFRVFGGEPSRHELDGVDEVAIGRGTGRVVRSGRRLSIELADARASEEHALLTRAIGRWKIEDRSSKNGTFVNGSRVTDCYLADGDDLEIGRTTFVFASELERTGDALPDARPAEPLPGIATLVPWFEAELAQLARLAASSTPLVITGPTGCGKEVIARAIHAVSERPGKLVAVNCGALPRDLVEATLFGHRRGAFSGAVDDAPGLVREADGGTLFLDELGDLPLPAQAALLRVLQEREVLAVGASRPVAVDLRVVCATHRDLSAMVAAGTFRADLLHRVRGFTISLPALVDRRVDLGVLAASVRARAGAPPPILHPRAVRALLSYAWPGNVRELEQVLAAAAALAGDGPIEVAHLPREIREAPRTPANDPQREQLLAQLAEHRGNIRAVARTLGKDPVQIRRWLRRYGLDAAAFREA